MDFKLELIVIPVSDVDKVKDFYTDNAGFRLDVDHRAGEDFRVVQLTPPGIGVLDHADAHTTRAAGSVQGLHLRCHRHRGRQGRARRARRRGRRDLPLRGRGPEAGTRPASGPLQLLPVVQRPGRQRLDGAGGQRQPGPARRDRGQCRGPGRRVRRARRAAPARAARALLPDARLVRRRRGRRAGDAAAGLAGRGRFDGSDARFRAWLYRIATNVCLDQLRRRAGSRPRCARSPRCRGCSRTRTGCSTRSPPAADGPTRSWSSGRRSRSPSSPPCRSCRRASGPH